MKTVALLKLAENKMLQDVATRWNLTFKMLEFALKYRAAINAMTEDRTMELWKYELDDEK